MLQKFAGKFAPVIISLRSDESDLFFGTCDIDAQNASEFMGAAVK